MKKKIYAVLATGLAVLFLGAAPSIGKKSSKSAKDSGVLVCRFDNGSGGAGMMRGVLPDSSLGSMMNDSQGGRYGMMDGPRDRGMVGGRYGMGNGMGMMSMMMNMMGMMNGSMMGTRFDSSASYPYGSMMGSMGHNRVK